MARISDPQDSQQPPAPSQPANSGKTVLLAEDDPFISRMYQTKLASAGYNVVMATDGREAYEHIKSDQPDMILLDINMPELTGYEVVKALKHDGEDDLIKRIIILTNSANPADRKLANDMGIEYIVKADLTPHDVLNQIHKKIGD